MIPGEPSENRQTPVGRPSDLTPKTASEMRNDAGDGRRSRGHRAAAQTTGYSVGGKTGTAYKVGWRRVCDAALTGPVTGCRPSDPRLIVAVMIDEPSGGRTLAAVAAPVFSDAAANALRSMNIAPDSQR